MVECCGEPIRCVCHFRAGRHHSPGATVAGGVWVITKFGLRLSQLGNTVQVPYLNLLCLHNITFSLPTYKGM